MTRLAIILFLFTSASFADEPGIKLPARIEAKVGLPVKVQAETTAKSVAWILIDEGRANQIPLEDQKSTLFTWLVPTGGDIRLIAICTSGEMIYQAKTLIVVGGSPPGPGPTPPPAPVDLRKKLQDAYTADAAPEALKDRQKTQVIGLYQAMSETTKSPQITTTDQLKGMLSATASAMLKPLDESFPGGVLVPVRKVIAAEVATALGPAPATLTDELRGRAVALFSHIAAELKEVK